MIAGTAVPSAFITKMLDVFVVVDWIALSNVKTIFASPNTPVAASAGTLVTVGAVKSAAVVPGTDARKASVAGVVPES